MLWAPRLLAAATIWSRYRERTSANVMGGPLFEYATWPLLHQPSCLPCKRFQNSIDTRRVVIYCHNLGMLIRTIALLAITAAAAAPTEPEVLKLSGDVEGVHDPVIIKQKDTYYVFCTGVGHGGTGGIIPIRTSKDLIHWTNAGTALPGIPDWGKREIPGARDAWAPDISYYKGKGIIDAALSGAPPSGTHTTSRTRWWSPPSSTPSSTTRTSSKSPTWRNWSTSSHPSSAMTRASICRPSTIRWHCSPTTAKAKPCNFSSTSPRTRPGASTRCRTWTFPPHSTTANWSSTPSTDQSLAADFDLEDKQFSGPVAVSEVTGPNLKSEKDFDKTTVTTVERSVTTEARRLRYTFPPHSYTMLKVGTV